MHCEVLYSGSTAKELLKSGSELPGRPEMDRGERVLPT